MIVRHYTVVLAHSLMMERNFITNKDVGLQPIHLCSVGLSNGNGALTNMQVTNWYQPPFFSMGTSTTDQQDMGS